MGDASGIAAVNIAFTTLPRGDVISPLAYRKLYVVKGAGKGEEAESRETAGENTLPAKFDRLPASLSPGFTTRLWKSLAASRLGNRPIAPFPRSPPRFLPAVRLS